MTCAKHGKISIFQREVNGCSHNIRTLSGTVNFPLKKIMVHGFLILLLLFLSCGKNKKEEMGYSVEIKKVDNVIHIINPEFPKSKPREFILKEELSIGNDTDDNYIFGRIKKLGVDEKNNIYVLDIRRYCVKIFDKQGIYISSVSKKGEGPGEIALPIDLIVDDKNKMIHILDYKNMKIARYHFNGSFESDLKLKDGSPDHFFLVQKDFYLIDYDYMGDKRNLKHRIIKYSLDGKMISKSKEFFDSNLHGKEEGGLTIIFNSYFDPKLYFACDQKGYLYHGFSNKYEITVFDPALKKSMVFTKTNPEKFKVSQEEKESFLKGLKEKMKKKGATFNVDSVKFPEYHPLFRSIWLDDRDRILVNTRIANGKAFIDVFNREGVYQEKMIIYEPPYDTTLAWIFHRPIFKNGCIYSAVMNEEGMPLVKKYRLVEKELIEK